jgi:hypothetical protein
MKLWKIILMAGILVLALSVEVQAEPTKNVKVVNEPNFNVLNNVDTTITNDATNPVPVTVQNGNGGTNEKELVEIVQLDVPHDTILPVYTVPSGKKLVITDVIVSGIGDSFMEIRRDGVVVSRVNKDRHEIYQHTYNSGIEFQENQVLSINNPNLTPEFLINWELRGYQVDVDGS